MAAELVAIDVVWPPTVVLEGALARLDGGEQALEGGDVSCAVAISASTLTSAAEMAAFTWPSDTPPPPAVGDRIEGCAHRWHAGHAAALGLVVARRSVHSRKIRTPPSAVHTRPESRTNTCYARTQIRPQPVGCRRCRPTPVPSSSSRVSAMQPTTVERSPAVTVEEVLLELRHEGVKRRLRDLADASAMRPVTCAIVMGPTP